MPLTGLEALVSLGIAMVFTSEDFVESATPGSTEAEAAMLVGVQPSGPAGHASSERVLNPQQ